VRLVNFEAVEHGQNAGALMLESVVFGARRNVRRRIAARVVSDTTIAPREMAQLRFPAAVLAHEFVHEQDSRSLAGFLVVQLDAAGCGDMGHVVSSRWVLAGC
jgi:hypothetical protein